MKIRDNKKHILLPIFTILFAPSLIHACGNIFDFHEYTRENIAFLITTPIFLLLALKLLHSGYQHSHRKITQQDFLQKILRTSTYTVYAVVLLYVIKFLTPLLDNTFCLHTTTNEQMYAESLISYFSTFTLSLAAITYLYVVFLKRKAVTTTHQTLTAFLLLLTALTLPIVTLLATTIFIPETIPAYFKEKLQKTEPPTLLEAGKIR